MKCFNLRMTGVRRCFNHKMFIGGMIGVISLFISAILTLAGILFYDANSLADEIELEAGNFKVII